MKQKRRVSMVVALVLIISAVFIMLACATMPTPSSYKTDIQYESKPPLVTITMVPSWTKSGLFGSGFAGFDCTFKNNSEKVVRIVWEQSSINYNGNSYVPFIDGQKYSDAQTPMSPMAIAKNGKITKSLFSSNQPYYNSGRYGGWYMRPISANEVELVICIKSEDKEEFITVKVNAVMDEQ